MTALGSDHPSDHTLRAYGVGKLYGALADSVHSHLDICGDCRQRVASLSDDTFLGRLRDAQARPQSPAPAGLSFGGVSRLDGVSGPSADPVGSIPQDLADHPDYEILGELGRGGMGVVYLAQNKLMARKEVLKVVSRELMDRRGVLDRFLREIRSAAQLHHPNIVGAYSAFRAGQSIVFAMEYVEGQDLAGYVKAQGPLPVVHAVYFIAQAALGLQCAHEKGLVHRDIKPSNLILAKQQRRALVKVLDFGLAKARREGPVEKGLTHEGQMLGTPDYIAPEQSLDATKADIRADIYSLGCTLHYLLAGSPPFQGTSLYEVLQAHHSMEAKPLNLLRPDVPWELAAVVAKMMAKDPGRRYQTPGEVAQALKPFYKRGGSEQAAGKAELSQAGQPPPVERVARSVPVAYAPQSPPASPANEPAALAERGSIWHSLVWTDAARRKLLRPGGAAPLPVWPPPPWIWPVVAGVVLLGLLIWRAPGVLKLKTPDGVIVVENVPANAAVEVDGDKVTATPAKGEPIQIKAPPGRHRVRVKRGEDLLLDEPVTLEPGGQVRLSVALKEPIVTPVPLAAPVAPARPESSPSRWTSPSTQMRFVRIDGGDFLMGSQPGDQESNNDEKPQHKVRISPFFLGMTEVTQAEYVAVMGRNSSWFSSTGGGREKVADKSPGQHPAENMSWFDAVEFCNTLSQRDDLAQFYEISGDRVRVFDWRSTGYRLPTEAEWECACRSGGTTAFYFGNDGNQLSEYGWFLLNSQGVTHPVGAKRPNVWGLFDMHGNVWEWCWDAYKKDSFAHSSVEDPHGEELSGQATPRVLRGGSWFDGPQNARSSTRFRFTSGLRDYYLGFRVARFWPSR